MKIVNYNVLNNLFEIISHYQTLKIKEFQSWNIIIVLV